MPAVTLTHVGLGGLLKFNENPDGTLDFELSKATGPELDSDAQIADPTWARDAMGQWFATAGNLRDMHQPVAAGKALTLEQRDDGEYITGRVVDPTSVVKAKNGLYGGLSIGIANPRVVKDVAAPGGRIVGGRIVEISLVDVPANPACRLMLAKADGAGNAVFVEELVEDVAAPGGRIDKVVGAEPAVVANADDPDADPEALDKAKKAKGKPFGDKKAPSFGGDDKPKGDDDAGDGEDDSDDDEKKPAGKKKTNSFAKVAGLDSDDLAAIVKAVIAELPAMQAATAQLVAPAETEPVEKAAEPDLAKSADDEMNDIARAKRILSDLAILVQSEAAGFLAGGKNSSGEVWDLDLLVGVMTQLTCFVEREEMEAAAMAEDTAAGGDTTPVPTVMQLAATPDVEKAAEPSEPVAPVEPAAPNLGTELARRLDKAMKKARKNAALKAAATETTAPEAVSNTDTETLTKAVAAQVTADLAGQLGDVLTKAMGPVIDRVAEVETLLKSTPRPGGPAVTRVQPQVSPAELVKAAATEKRKADLSAMYNATPPTERTLRAEIEKQIAALG